jgi:hypothetical protein
MVIKKKTVNIVTYIKVQVPSPPLTGVSLNVLADIDLLAAPNPLPF